MCKFCEILSNIIQFCKTKCFDQKLLLLFVQIRFLMKISFTKALILSAILTMTFCVRLKSHKEYNQQEYLNSLQSQQDKFESGVQKLQDSVSSVDQSLTQTQKIQDKISILENAVLNQQQSIFSLSSQMIPPLNLSTCNCQAMTKQKRQELEKRTSNTLEKITILKEQLDALEGRENDPKYIQMRNNAENQIFYLKTIQNVLYSQCQSQAILAPTVFQSNIYANNWILGNQDINSLVQSYIERSKSSDSITNCPIQKPFYNGVDCIKCQGQTPIFNMETNKCVACPEGQELDAKLRTCIESINYISNLLTAHPWVTQDGNTTKALEDFTDHVQSGNYQFCPTDNPFIVDGECGRCDIGHIYHVQLQTCVIPSKDLVYDPNIHSLVTPQQGKETIPNATNLLTSGDLADSAVLENCPNDRPFYDGIACISCPDPTPLFNTATKTCVACSAFEFYNAEKRTCETRQVLFENGNYKNLVGLPNTKIDEYLQTMVELQQQHPQAIIVECKDTENSVITSCIQCGDNQVFNTVSLKCVVCEKLDEKSKTCNDGVYFQTNLEAANGTLIVNQEKGLQGFLDQMKANSTDAVDVAKCPADKAYANGEKCFACPREYPLFNVSSLKCTRCPENNSYDSQSQTCKKVEQPQNNGTGNITQPQVTITNTRTANNLIGKSSEQVQQYIQNQSSIATSDTNVVSCPNETPYFNGSRCITCEDPDNLFDINSKSCTRCRQGTHYNFESHVCEQCPIETKWNDKNSRCQATNLAFVSNPGAQNFVGESSEQVNNYTAEALSTAQKNPGTIVCPIGTPYSDGSKCFKCEAQTPYFNIKQLQCVACQKNQLYKSQEFICFKCPLGTAPIQERGECVTVPSVTNPKAFNNVLIPEGSNITDYTPDQSLMPCSMQVPYYNGEKCIDCPDDQQFNAKTLKCELCPSGTYFVSFTHQCQLPNKINPDAVDKVITGNASKISAITQADVPCPKDKPFFNGQFCLACQGHNKLFNLDQKECTRCPEGQILDKTTHKCISPSSITNFDAGVNRILIPQGQNYQEVKQTIENQENVKACPVSTPFFNGEKCVDCQLGQIFDIQTSECSSCPEFEVFNKDTHSCDEKQYESDLSSGNWLSSDPEKVQIINQEKLESGALKCPEDKPFSTGTKCIQCEESSFEIKAQKCVKCPAGQIIDLHKHVCVAPSEYITNPQTAPLLLYDGISQQQILNSYKNEKANNANIADCSQDTPYFNGASCIPCTGLKPYFNMALNVCQDCPKDTHYDAETHECMKNVVQGATLNTDASLEKQLANVFTHKKDSNKANLHRLH